MVRGLTNFANELDWTPIVVYELALKVVARISYRAFIGSDVCINHS
jgi:hypothetical protein